MRITTLFTLFLGYLVSGQHTIPEITKLGPNLRLETGLYIPLGKFAETIDPSPSFGLIGGIELTDKFRLDPQLMFFIPQSRKTVLIDGEEGVISGRINSLSLNFGATLNRVYILSPNSLFELRAGTGLSVLETDRKKESADNCDDSNDHYYGTATPFFKAGIGFKTRLL
ncbi:hypothetical protein BST97_14750 [Nonlabens spongiae]|uniref:Outer membrane protein beta-barrel domain-containing protein n=1 Tax=Nonlabens spongiae TaxID=331648 RepID=A0A1W6MNH5_9FLAO|nr:hypothetical protein [Nonlabens spongiae]ARN79141.1 hypothetical protein BST97_14750 [Nonlabens spongiae]